MTDRFEERARELACMSDDPNGLGCQEGETPGVCMICDTQAANIAAALRAEHERGVREERERWVATLREFVAMMDGDFMGHEPDHNCHISKVTALVLAKKMGVALDAPDGGEP